MIVPVPVVAIFGILLYLACRYMGLRTWHAVIAVIFGFLLAATTTAPEIRSLLSALSDLLGRPLERRRCL